MRHFWGNMFCVDKSNELQEAINSMFRATKVPLDVTRKLFNVSITAAEHGEYKRRYGALLWDLEAHQPDFSSAHAVPPYHLIGNATIILL